MEKWLEHKPLFAITLAAVAGLYGVTMWGSAWLPPAELAVNQTAAVGGEQPEPVPAPRLFQFIEVMDGCGPNYEGACVNQRSGPGVEYPSVAKLRSGMVLKIAETVVGDDGREWYKISYDEGLRYPERVSGDRYVAAEVVRLFTDEGNREAEAQDLPASTKQIIVDRSEQMLYAYDGEELFMKEPISTGLELTPTPRGNFRVYKMTPSRYMQGPLPGISDQYYDLPGVPWNLYFTYQGAVIHGAYWHNNFGEPWSHGCVNLPTNQAKKLYQWAELGTQVIVRD